MSEKNENIEEDELDDLLEKQWEKQDLIHKSCKMKDKPKIFKNKQ